MSEVRAFVDRFEGDMAVLLLGDECCKCIVPRAFLPADTLEGTVLRLSFEVDPEASEQAYRDVADLIDRLKRKDF